MRKKIQYSTSVLYLVFTLFFISCSKDNNNIEETENSYLVSTEVKYLFSESILESYLGYPNIKELVKNGIVTYKLSYTTKYDNNNITASGTLTIPDTPGEYPLVLVERSTILENSDSPSESILPSYEVLAGMGFIVFVPDMIGYGDSSYILHPYFDYEYSATASIDMYHAVVEYFDESKSTTTTNNDFFITGYSQGGYSAMATYKYIIEENIDVDIVAVGTGAGGYDVMSMVDNILKNDVYPATVLLAMPMVTYNELYAHHPISDIFNSPYDAMVQNVIDGEKEWNDIAYSLPTTIKDIFNANLIDDLKAGKITFLTHPMIDNSVHNWAPSLPLRLYHFNYDEIIPITTTYSTLNKMNDNGATDVEFIEIPISLVKPGPSAHSSAGFGALFLAFTEFEKY